MQSDARRYLETGLEINQFLPSSSLPVCSAAIVIRRVHGSLPRFCIGKNSLGVDELQSDMNILAYTN